MALFAMCNGRHEYMPCGLFQPMPFSHGAHRTFQAEKLKMGIVAVKGNNKKQLSANPHATMLIAHLGVTKGDQQHAHRLSVAATTSSTTKGPHTGSENALAPLLAQPRKYQVFAASSLGIAFSS